MVLILTLIISFATAFACEFNLPHSFIVFNDNGVDQNIMNSKDCGEDAKSELTKLISSFDGRVASFQIQEMMSSKGHRVSINPQSLQVQQFKTILREQLILPQGIHLKNAQLQNLKNSLVLNPGDQIEVSCTSCLYGNRQPLNLTIKGFDGFNLFHRRFYWIATWTWTHKCHTTTTTWHQAWHIDVQSIVHFISSIFIVPCV
jgi:hypothetical protein